MITEDYVSFETAKLLKEKGFDEKCKALYTFWFDEEVEGPKEDRAENWNVEQRYFSAPTLQMAMKWLREVHHLYIQLVLNQDVIDEKYEIENYYHFNVSRLDHFANEGGDCKWYKSYEEACEGAIKYCLEEVI